MRHNKNFNHLGRQAGHRKALMSNMASSLILHKRIETTLAKAKALRQFVEPLVTKSKEDTTHSRRVVFSYLKQKEAVTELFRTIAPKIAERNGGYTRILKTGFRLGDAADMCIIEFVDFNEAYTTGVVSTEAKPKTRRSRKPAAKKTDAVEDATVVKAAPKAKPAAQKAAKNTGAKVAATKTNVGKKM
jgi:large subunit ribosomal protein L17